MAFPQEVSDVIRELTTAVCVCVCVCVCVFVCRWIDWQEDIMTSVQGMRTSYIVPVHCPLPVFGSLITGSLLIYDHDFHLPFPQYQQVVDGIENPSSSHFRIGFSAWHTAAVQLSPICQPEYLCQSAEHSAHQHLVHCFSPFRSIKEGCDECVCFMSNRFEHKVASESLFVKHTEGKDCLCAHAWWIHLCSSNVFYVFLPLPGARGV